MVHARPRPAFCVRRQNEEPQVLLLLPLAGKEVDLNNK